ncbi:MAG: RibD family protein, partial [Fimbriimonadaceae bacterium]|nr:RibD family protein [Fimbriimonadaceae bacterium]
DFQMTRRPRVTLKAAVSADGFMAGLPGSPRVQITGEAAQAHGRRLRCEAGAVLVGSGTIRTDHPLLTARIPEAVNDPVRVVLDSKAALDPSEPALQGPEAMWIVGPGLARLEPQVEAPLDSSGRIDPEAVLTAAGRRGIPGLLVEGGPTIHESFLKLADEIDLYQSPDRLGGGRPWPGPAPQTAADEGWQVAEFDRIGPDGFWRLLR